MPRPDFVLVCPKNGSERVDLGSPGMWCRRVGSVGLGGAGAALDLGWGEGVPVDQSDEGGGPPLEVAYMPKSILAKGQHSFHTLKLSPPRRTHNLDLWVKPSHPPTTVSPLGD